MKKTLSTLVVLMVTATLFAQIPQRMTYQAVVRDTNDNLLTVHGVSMQISILQGSDTGTAVFVERHFPTTNTNGLVTLEIGDGTLVSGSFASIDWADGPYFIKTETDPTGGTSYTITGTSQLLSVPYALHAKTAETVSGGINETDPIYGASQAADITASDIANLGNLSGTNTGDQDLSALATKTALGDSTAQVRTEIPDVSGFLTSETDPSVPTGTQAGQMQYWNGMEWITVEAGGEGQILSFVGGVPTWTILVGAITIGQTDVYNFTTGKTWMDRNLGATQVAVSSEDYLAYGSLFQWGRLADGHEVINWTSSTGSDDAEQSNVTATLSFTDDPGHGDFITTGSLPYDWRSPQNDNLWQGVIGINNPCPSGYRLPTDAEWEAERTSWGSNNAAGAFASPLKLPVAGYRGGSDGYLYNVGSYGFYWSSTLSSPHSRNLYFYISYASTYGNSRAYGYSVRCIKN
jgi:uncharacterized protein (TIGR02145 family)